MAAIILPSRRVVQPQGPVEIDWGNPLALGLVWAINPGAGRFHDAVSHTNFSPTTITKRAGRVGVEDFYSGRFEVATLRPIPSNSDLSILVLATATNTRQALFCQRVANDSSDIELRLASDNAGSEALNSVAFRANSDSVAPTWAAASVDLTSGPHVYAGTLRGSTQSIFVDGRVGGKRTNTNPVSTAATPVFGGLNGSTAIPFTGTAGLYAAWRRALSEAEVAEVSANPWQLFRPIQRRIWVPVAGGGGISQTVAFTLEDVSASVSQNLSHAQSLTGTLDDVTASVSQTLSHSQSLDATLDGVTVAASQTLSHSQALAATLDGITAAINQSAAPSSKEQSLAVTLDSIAVSIAQEGPANLIDTHDGFWAKEWARIRAREKRKYQEEIQERVEEIQDEIAEVEQQIVEVKQAPKPKKATPARDFYAEQARIVEHLIARRNQLIDEEDEELLLLL